MHLWICAQRARERESGKTSQSNGYNGILWLFSKNHAVFELCFANEARPQWLGSRLHIAKTTAEHPNTREHPNNVRSNSKFSISSCNDENAHEIACTAIETGRTHISEWISNRMSDVLQLQFQTANEVVASPKFIETVVVVSLLFYWCVDVLVLLIQANEHSYMLWLFNGNISPILKCVRMHKDHKFRKFMFNLLNRLIRFISFRGAHTSANIMRN